MTFYLCPQQVSFPGMEVAAPQRHPLMAGLDEDTFTPVLTDPFLMTTEGGDGALVATGGVGGVLAAEEGYCDTLTGREVVGKLTLEGPALKIRILLLKVSTVEW